MPEPRLEFEWDPANVRYIARHGVTAREVEEVIASDPADVGYDNVDGEPRWTVVGHTKSIRVLVVVWTLRGRKVRAVTARDAPKKLREDYFLVKCDL